MPEPHRGQHLHLPAGAEGAGGARPAAGRRARRRGSGRLVVAGLRGTLRAGENVLVLGAGTVGQIAVQAAKVLGAKRVIIADVRKEALDLALEQGADAATDVTGLDPAATEEAFVAATPEGYDLIVDLVWGDVVNAAIEAARRYARLVQTGNAASPTLQLHAGSFRNKQMSLIGQSVFLAPIEEGVTVLIGMADRSALYVTRPYSRSPMASIGRARSASRVGIRTAAAARADVAATIAR
ncbi:MDR/zinc-dependent alcohol dehydrogenase-like family protein [Catenulispora pinistramenti]|uniref:MDR/zinc-dependent alcohol dehydrogenase-like family protein n=1 Tax=Catenulispora pinistramenti TaxID=2705254 RepID=UPI001E28361A|nr:medium chain dehydrogenase/reductase family protein [Catenulispora pinistramenti]